jgi:hypothetical protein
MSHVQHVHVQCLAPAMARMDEGYCVAVRVAVRNGHDFASGAGPVLETA